MTGPWAWTCKACGHGHHATHKQRDEASHEHQANHALRKGIRAPKPGPEWTILVNAGVVPVISYTHHAEPCPECPVEKRITPDFY